MAISLIYSTGASATNGGNLALTLGGSAIPGDLVLITYSIPNSTSPLAIVSSHAAFLTQIATGLSTTAVVCKTGIFTWTQGSTLIDLVACSGGANSSDAVSGVAYVFRDSLGPVTMEASLPVATGSGTTPDSPQITVSSSNDWIISCVGSNVTDATVTAPTSFANQINRTANDTRDTTTGMATITLASTSPFNPGSWTNFGSGGWVAFTVGLIPTAASTYPDISYVTLDYPFAFNAKSRMVPY